jgi:hypothetical protein
MAKPSAAVGAVIGILLPPASIGTAAVGGVGGHLWRGISRADVNETATEVS